MTDNGSRKEPEVLDVLVAGGGPGGTAAAFRARELGLSALVIEYDDLAKRIRDYSKEKLILPGFGGGDKMRFPKGGELISALRFAPIDKDELCRSWKALYEHHGVVARVGFELTGLEENGDGTYEVLAWDHGERREASFRARSVVVALGRGVPRRFDIPGNTDGICYRLEETTDLVGAPACVIGGGTSAAEAVIAISRAKAAAGDPTAVYWSYRGDRMPRVSKALAEVFFEAYVGNGNILYFPRSEPAAIVTTDERAECLSIRVDRRQMSGRPNECTYLEFAKENVVACIGEDLPEALLASLDIRMVTGGPRGKRRMVVTRHLETLRRNVFLIGDLLSQAYFETDDFDADRAGFREVKHRGNIKSALRDGVLVAEVIRQRLEGKQEIEVQLEDAEDLEVPPGRARHGVGVGVSAAADRDGPPPASLGPERQVSEVEAYLIRLLPGGVEETEYPVPTGVVTTIGRHETDLCFPNDTLMSDQHASISHGEEGYFLRDDGSATGVFLRVPAARKRGLTDGDLIRAGRQFLVFSARNGERAFTHYDDKGNEVAHHRLADRTIVLGRQAPDVTLDGGDKTLSRRHLALSVEDGRLFVKDLKSANGTFLRVRSATRLEHGDELRAGLQRLVFSLRPDAVLETGRFAEQPLPAAAPPRSAVAGPAAESAAAASVAFEGTGRTLTLEPGQTLCEAAEANGIDITAECHSGICGSDPIRILAGAEHLDAEPGDQERETLEEICELEPGECRLACMVRARGPVKVEILRQG